VKDWKARPAHEQFDGPDLEAEAAEMQAEKDGRRLKMAQNLRNSAGIRMFLDYVGENYGTIPKFCRFEDWTPSYVCLFPSEKEAWISWVGELQKKTGARNSDGAALAGHYVDPSTYKSLPVPASGRVVTAEELAKNNGKDGAPLWFAVNTKICEVVDSSPVRNHPMVTQSAGRELCTLVAKTIDLGYGMCEKFEDMTEAHKSCIEDLTYSLLKHTTPIAWLAQ
jgi:predicted heme/steroid binding protein